MKTYFRSHSVTASSKRLCSLLKIIFLTLIVVLLGAEVVCAQTTTWVSKDSDGNERNGPNRFPSISVDGRYVVFESGSNDLVPDDTNGYEDIFVHDRETRETTRINLNTEGNQANSQTFNPSISADSRYVAFWSLADNLVPDDTNDWEGFVHDRETGLTNRVCVASSGEQGNNGCGAPFISANGRHVAFGSFSDNLVPGDTNGLFDTFVHDLETGETTRVSIDSDGKQADGGGYRVSISADGRNVVFESPFSNLVPDDTNEVEDIFVHDRESGKTTRVSVDSYGNEANGSSEIYWTHAVSADGRYVAFESIADNLVPNDTNGVEDIFVHDRETGETTRVSVDSDGVQANGYSGYQASISANGRQVTFWSSADNLVPDDMNGLEDIFVHDRETGKTIRVSVDSDGNEANGGSIEPSISPDGSYVAFASWGDNLVPEDTSNVVGWEIYVHGPLMAGALEVTIDIAPNRDLNRLKPEHGCLAVAILTEVAFDVNQINPESARFGSNEAEAIRYRSVDVDRDGDLDLVLDFNTVETGIACGDAEATLIGETIAGQSFTGTDSIKTIGCIHKKHY